MIAVKGEGSMEAVAYVLEYSAYSMCFLYPVYFVCDIRSVCGELLKWYVSPLKFARISHSE